MTASPFTIPLSLWSFFLPFTKYEAFFHFPPIHGPSAAFSQPRPVEADGGEAAASERAKKPPNLPVRKGSAVCCFRVLLAQGRGIPP